MIKNSGFTGVFKQMANAQPKFTRSFNSSNDKKTNQYYTGTVVGYPEDWNDGVIIDISSPPLGSTFAKSLNPFINYIPLIGETVLCFVNQSQKDVVGGDWYYMNINVWNNPTINCQSYSPQLLDKNSSTYFDSQIEKNNKQLYPFVGDFILEGRFGNSIRFGSTNNQHENQWSNNGEKFSPITIIKNGNNPNSNLIEKYSVESTNDLSSIYLTSNQSLSNFHLSTNENFSSYSSNITLPSNYLSPQILINSDRIILNSKTDEILISGNTSVGIFSNQSVNIESEKNIIQGPTYLGNKNAKESALLGDSTTQLLEKVITELKNISLALQTVPFAVGGVAQLSTPKFEKALIDLENIKSKTVKLS